jgi:6-phosphofructokinase 1
MFDQGAFMPIEHTKQIGILTTGGDAPGMNATVRAIARTALARGLEVYAIYEGYQGMVDEAHQRAKEQWWLGLRLIVQLLAQPGPSLRQE